MCAVYTHHFSFVRPPNNGFVVNGILCGSGPWDDLPIGDVERVQDADYSELASAGTLLFCQKLSVDMGTNQWAEVGGVKLDRLLELFEKEHGWDGGGLRRGQGLVQRTFRRLTRKPGNEPKGEVRESQIPEALRDVMIATLCPPSSFYGEGMSLARKASSVGAYNLG